jgi:hypothetical protein
MSVSPPSTRDCEDPPVRRLPLVLLAVLALSACGGDDDEASTAPCDLLTQSDVDAVLGDGLEPIEIPEEDAEAACAYGPPGTEVGDEPAQVAAIQVTTGMFESTDDLLDQGEELAGVGEAAIIETEATGFTIVSYVEDGLAFGLVVRGDDVERDEVVALAKTIVGRFSP